jgi:hypothetical protein
MESILKEFVSCYSANCYRLLNAARTIVATHQAAMSPPKPVIQTRDALRQSSCDGFYSE